MIHIKNLSWMVEDMMNRCSIVYIQTHIKVFIITYLE
jgi:hypothetical protein